VNVSTLEATRFQQKRIK